MQLRYTWLISRNVLEIKTGDKFGIFEVKEANENYVLLHNKNNINLGQNAVIDLANGLKFKVADSSTALRFYPFFEQVIKDAPKVDLKVATANATTPSAESSTSAETTTPSTSSAVAVQASSPVTKPVDNAKPRQYDWILFAVAGLVGTGYMVLRR